MFPSFGLFFGVVVARVSHEGASDEAHGVEGILQAYGAALHGVTLAGPTLFSEVLQKAIGRARKRESSQVQQRYDVLLILTDGIINDMKEVRIGLSRDPSVLRFFSPRHTAGVHR